MSEQRAKLGLLRPVLHGPSRRDKGIKAKVAGVPCVGDQNGFKPKGYSWCSFLWAVTCAQAAGQK